MMKKNQTVNILTDQVIAGYVLQEIQKRAIEQNAKYVEIAQETASEIQRSTQAFNHALEYIEKCRVFVSPSNLPHVLGPETTKHGEIAESLQVNFTNGRAALEQIKTTARFLEEGKDRIGPTDYVIGNTPIQSKFLNGTNKSLEAIHNHLEKYPGYANDASPYGFPGQHGIYHIPKDQYDIMQKVMSGETEGLSTHTINAIKGKIQEIERQTGKNISEVVHPGLNSYKEVQLGRVDETISKEEKSYYDRYEQKNDEIREQQKVKNEEASHITDASWSEAFKAVGIGAAISGITAGGISIYKKIKSGKKIYDFTLSDWEEVGIDFAKGGAKGGISAIGIYGLTKLGGFSAPFAGAIVSTGMGITSLLVDYHNGNISKSDFADATMALSVEAGFSAIGAAIGQSVIPIPILGGIIGSVVAQSALSITKSVIGDKETELIKKLQEEYDIATRKLSEECKKKLQEIELYFSKLGGLIEACFNTDANLRLIGSVELCRYLKVDESEIIHDTSELDTFMGY